METERALRSGVVIWFAKKDEYIVFDEKAKMYEK